MFHEMRRKEERMEEKEAIEILKKNEYGILSTIGEDGYPYGVPVNYVYTHNALYIHGAQKGHKLENINYNNKISFCVVNSNQVIAEKFTTYFESVILFGTVSEVSEEEKKEALFQLISRFSPGFEEKGKKMIEKVGGVTKVLRIDIEHISGKAKRG